MLLLLLFCAEVLFDNNVVITTSCAACGRWSDSVTCSG